MSYTSMSRNPAGRRSVLVVDDDRDIRALLQGILEDAGYSVAEARDGQMALDLLQRTTERWVVLTDHLMPHLNGPGLIAAALADPQLRTRHAYIYMTAADQDLDADLQLQLDAVRASVLRKPFYSADCLALVASAAERLANTTV